MSADKQSRFSRQRNHIFLTPEKKQKEPRPPRKGKKKRPFPTRSTSEYPTLVNEISELHQRAITRTKILRFPQMHFMIELSDKMTWKAIANSVKRLGVSVVDYINEKTIRVSLEKDSYEVFLSNLKKSSRYIQSIREIGFVEKIDKKLCDEITKNPEEKNWISMEFSNANGVENVSLLEESLQLWIQKNDDGPLGKSYQSDTMLLLSGFLRNRTVETIAKEVESISYIAKIPKIQLSEIKNGNSLSLSSVIPLGDVSKSLEKDGFQSIVTIDSGINHDHTLLSNHVEDTFDYSTGQSNPCSDMVGHGSSVSGLAIYGDDLRKASVPSAKIIMVKNFEKFGNNSREINKDMMKVIRESIEKYRFDSRILNLSFNMLGPNPSISRALDELIFQSDYIVVVSAGNIDPNTISSFLDINIQYPDYNDSRKVFFPADCNNVVTVGSHTVFPSNFVSKNCPSPFTRCGFSTSFVKPDVMAHGGNFENTLMGGQHNVFGKSGLGILSVSHIDNQKSENFGTSFSSPIVANVAAQIVQKRVDFSTFLVKALLISSCNQMVDPNTGSCFSETLQGFGRIDKIRAISSQDWRTCYLMQGEFNKTNTNEYHRYLFLFPEEADKIEVTIVCGKPKTGYDQENDDYIHLYFKRPGVKSKTRLKKGLRIGKRKCSVTYKEKVSIERGSRGVWRVDVHPHFSGLSPIQKMKYGIVIAVSSSKINDIHSKISKWIDLKTEKIVAPPVIKHARRLQEPVP